MSDRAPFWLSLCSLACSAGLLALVLIDRRDTAHQIALYETHLDRLDGAIDKMVQRVATIDERVKDLTGSGGGWWCLGESRCSRAREVCESDREYEAKQGRSAPACSLQAVAFCGGPMQTYCEATLGNCTEVVERRGAGDLCVGVQ